MSVSKIENLISAREGIHTTTYIENLLSITDKYFNPDTKEFTNYNQYKDCVTLEIKTQLRNFCANPKDIPPFKFREIERYILYFLIYKYDIDIKDFAGQIFDLFREVEQVYFKTIVEKATNPEEEDQSKLKIYIDAISYMLNPLYYKKITYLPISSRSVDYLKDSTKFNEDIGSELANYIKKLPESDDKQEINKKLEDVITKYKKIIEYCNKVLKDGDILFILNFNYKFEAEIKVLDSLYKMALEEFKNLLMPYNKELANLDKTIGNFTANAYAATRVEIMKAQLLDPHYSIIEYHVPIGDLYEDSFEIDRDKFNQFFRDIINPDLLAVFEYSTSTYGVCSSARRTEAVQIAGVRFEKSIKKPAQRDISCWYINRLLDIYPKYPELAIKLVKIMYDTNITPPWGGCLFSEIWGKHQKYDTHSETSREVEGYEKRQLIIPAIIDNQALGVALVITYLRPKIFSRDAESCKQTLLSIPDPLVGSKEFLAISGFVQQINSIGDQRFEDFVAIWGKERIKLYCNQDKRVPKPLELNIRWLDNTWSRISILSKVESDHIDCVRAKVLAAYDLFLQFKNSNEESKEDLKKDFLDLLALMEIKYDEEVDYPKNLEIIDEKKLFTRILTTLLEDAGSPLRANDHNLSPHSLPFSSSLALYFLRENTTVVFFSISPEKHNPEKSFSIIYFPESESLNVTWTDGTISYFPCRKEIGDRDESDVTAKVEQLYKLFLEFKKENEEAKETFLDKLKIFEIIGLEKEDLESIDEKILFTKIIDNLIADKEKTLNLVVCNDLSATYLSATYFNSTTRGIA